MRRALDAAGGEYSLGSSRIAGPSALSIPCSIRRPALELAPQIGPGEVDHFVGPAADHRFDHVERKTLRHFHRDRRRHGKFGPGDDGINQDRPVMRQCRGDASLHLAWVLESDSAPATGFGHCREVRVLELGAEWEKARRLLLELDKAERTIVEHDDLYRQ